MSLIYIVDRGPCTQWAVIPSEDGPAPEDRIIGIEIGPVTQLRGVRGCGGRPGFAKCGHPSRAFGQCALPLGHQGCHVYSGGEQQTATSDDRCGIRGLFDRKSRCVLEHGHAGAHVYAGQETRDHSTT